MSDNLAKTDEPRRAWGWIVFGDAMSDIPAHNYLNHAYHEANVHYRVPPYGLHWNILAIAVPRRVRKLIHIDEIVGQIKESITKAREIIEEARSYLDVEITRAISYSPDGPHPYMHGRIAVERCEPEGYAPSWAYTFNAYRLALALLNDYEQFIDLITKSRLVPFTQVAKIYQKARSYHDSARLVESEMIFHDMSERV